MQVKLKILLLKYLNKLTRVLVVILARQVVGLLIN